MIKITILCISYKIASLLKCVEKFRLKNLGLNYHEMNDWNKLWKGNKMKIVPILLESSYITYI